MIFPRSGRCFFSQCLPGKQGFGAAVSMVSHRFVSGIRRFSSMGSQAHCSRFSQSCSKGQFFRSRIRLIGHVSGLSLYLHIPAGGQSSLIHAGRFPVDQGGGLYFPYAYDRINSTVAPYKISEAFIFRTTSANSMLLSILLNFVQG